MKAIITILFLTLTSLLAKADFLSLPIQCVGQIVGNQEVDISISIKKQSQYIIGQIQDHGDRADLICAIVAIADDSHYHSVDCRGRWLSDGSPAQLSATLSTYVPFTQILRSQGSFGAQMINGMCVVEQ